MLADTGLGPPHGHQSGVACEPCHDAGFDCDHEIVAADEEEILQQAAEHVTGYHQVEVTPELVEQVQGLIHQVEDE